MIDLHTHTTCSDGTFTPEALVHYALEKDLKAVAITDHDTVSGNEKALKEGESAGMEVISGVELSAECDEGSLHILGLFVDSHNKKLIRAAAELQRKRRERNLKILEKLSDLGIDIERNAFLKNAYLGRPHIARILTEKGYTKTIDEAFEKFLKKGASAYVVREKLPPKETVEAIVDAGGLPILAHPVTLASVRKAVESLLSFGLKGIEVYYPTHSEDHTLTFLTIAQSYHLLVTGGSDFHGSHKPHIDLGCMRVPCSLLDELKKSRSHAGV